MEETYVVHTNGGLLLLKESNIGSATELTPLYGPLLLKFFAIRFKTIEQHEETQPN